MPKPDYIEKGYLGLDQASVGPVSSWVGEMPQYAKRVEVRTVGQITTIYTAWADYGALEGDSVWLVQQVVLDETNGLDLTDGLAGGVAGDFAYSWNDRATHIYS